MSSISRERRGGEEHAPLPPAEDGRPFNECYFFAECIMNVIANYKYYKNKKQRHAGHAYIYK